MGNLITIGLVVGLKRFRSAVCVVEIEDRVAEGRSVEHFVVRNLERLPAGAEYPQIAARLSEIAEGLKQLNQDRPFVFVDVTGLGEPVIEFLREQTTGISQFTPVFFNHGDRRKKEEVSVHLGKAFLVTKLKTLLQSNSLHLPKTESAIALADELMAYDLTVDSDANDRSGAFSVGRHDDLVTALGLAVQETPERPPVGGVF